MHLRRSGQRALVVVIVGLAGVASAVIACSSTSDVAPNTTDGHDDASVQQESAAPTPEAAAPVDSGSLSFEAGGNDAAVGCVPACDAGLSCVKGACRGYIDFETIPDAAPADNLPIHDQFESMYGVTFGIDANKDGKPDPGVHPVLAKVGPPATAFVLNDNSADWPAPGQNVGTYFLTDDGVLSGPPSPLIVIYSSPVSGAYAQIIDIDGAEAWTIEALNDASAVIDQIDIKGGDPGTGDGVATAFAFTRPTADISAIRLVYTGVRGTIGLAFDNFSPASSVAPPDQPPPPVK